MEASIEEVIQIREVRQHWVVLVVNAKRTLIRARNLRDTVAAPPLRQRQRHKMHRGQELRAADA